jgi:hypothetical protein
MILPPKSSKHPEAHVDHQSYPNSSKATITCKSEYANDTDNSDKDLMIQIQTICKRRFFFYIKNTGQLEEQKFVNLPLNRQRIQNLTLHS